MIFNLNKFLLNIKNITIFILFCVFNFSAYGMENDSNFRKVEATGRAVLVDGNIDISRKRALEDALYIAALKGGANVNGFSSIGKNTVINDQAIVTAASRVIDFKIVKEIQEKEEVSYEKREFNLDEREIADILDEYIRPAVESDGGAITLDSYKDGVVAVNLSGACNGCPSASITLKQGIEELLKDKLGEKIKEVVSNQG